MPTGASILTVALIVMYECKKYQLNFSYFVDPREPYYHISETFV